MRKRPATQCAYCSQPLRLVAGFCSQCHAPAAIAQRAKLIADARRHAAATATSTGTTTLMVPPGMAPRPMPGWTRLLLILGLASMVLTVFFITLHLNGNALPLPFVPGASSLTTGSTASDAPATAFHVGQPFYLRYAVAVTHADATVQVRIAPTNSPAYLLTEQWPRGDTARALPLVALTAGTWQITLLANGQVVRSLAVAIIPSSP